LLPVSCSTLAIASAKQKNTRSQGCLRTADRLSDHRQCVGSERLATLFGTTCLPLSYPPSQATWANACFFISRVCGSARRVVVDQLLVRSYVAMPVTWRYAFCSPPSCTPMVRHPWYAPWPDEEYFCCQFHVLHLLLHRPSRKAHAPRVV